MSIIYSLICKHQAQNDEVITLATYDSATGNYPQVMVTLLQKMTNEKQTKITYEYNSMYNFHVLRDGVLSFVCMADVVFNAKVAFTFLEELKSKFKEKFTNEQISVAQSHGLASEFAPTYRNLVNFFNSNQQADKKAILSKKLTDLKDVMTENIEKILQREEKVELFVKRANKTDKFAQDIKNNASKIKQQAFWRSNRCKIMIGGVLLAGGIAAFFLI